MEASDFKSRLLSIDDRGPDYCRRLARELLCKALQALDDEGLTERTARIKALASAVLTESSAMLLEYVYNETNLSGVEFSTECQTELAVHYMAAELLNRPRRKKDDPYWGRSIMYSMTAATMSVDELFEIAKEG